MCSVPTDRFVPTQEAKFFDFSKIERAPEFEPDTQGRSFRAQRSFAAAIPALRFKSGMRFELNNGKGSGAWSVEFFFGDSKRIHSIPLGVSLKDEIESTATSEVVLKVLRKASQQVAMIASDFEHQRLQSVWNGTAEGLHPYEIVDSLGEIALQAIKGISKFSIEERVEALICKRLPKQTAFSGRQKIAKYANDVFIGLYIGSVFNAATGAR